MSKKKRLEAASQKGETSFDLVSTRLAAMVKRAAIDCASPEEWLRLRCEIDNILDAGNEAVIEATYSHLSTREEVGKLDYLLDDVSQRIEVEIPGKGGACQTGEALLFAIPLILNLPVGHDRPRVLNHLDKYISSLHQHGLIGPGQVVYLSGILHGIPELELSPRERKAYLHHLVETQARENIPRFLPLKHRAARHRNNAEPRRLILCFLVGAVVYDLRGDTPFYPDDPDLDAYHTRCETWSSCLSAWLREDIGAELAVALPPEVLTDALQRGFNGYQGTALKIVTRYAIEHTAQRHSRCRASLGFRGFNGELTEILVGFHDGLGRLINGYSWPVTASDPVDALLEYITEALRADGVDDLEIIEGQSQSEGCPCCGKPLLMVPEQTGPKPKHPYLH